MLINMSTSTGSSWRCRYRERYDCFASFFGLICKMYQFWTKFQLHPTSVRKRYVTNFAMIKFASGFIWKFDWIYYVIKNKKINRDCKDLRRFKTYKHNKYTYCSISRKKYFLYFCTNMINELLVEIHQNKLKKKERYLSFSKI